MSRPRFPCSLHRRLQHSRCTDLGCPASLNCYLMKEMSCWAILDGRLCQKLHLITWLYNVYTVFWLNTILDFCHSAHIYLLFFHHMDCNFTRLLSSFKNILLWALVPYRFFTKIIQLWLCILYVYCTPVMNMFLCVSVWLKVELFPQTFEQLLVSWHNIVLGVYFAPGPMCDNSWNADASGWTLTHRDCVD